MDGKLPKVSLETQMEEAERKGREEGHKKGMADLFAALSPANSGDRRVAVVDHQQRDGQSYYQAHLDLSAAMLNADRQRRTEVVLFLIAGADVKTCYPDGHTILHRAVEDGQTELVKTYLKAGADPNFTKVKYWTPLTCAVVMGHTEIVKALVAAGVDLNNGKEPEEAEWLIDYEREGDHAEMTRILLEAGAYFGPNRRDSWTPLMSACRHGKTKSADLLIKAGSDVNAANADGETALIVAPCADRGSVIDTICLLLNSDAEINIKDNEGWTVLMNTVSEGGCEAVSLLLSAGADVFSRAHSIEAEGQVLETWNAFDMAEDAAVKEVLKSEMHRCIAAALSALPGMPVDVRQKVIQLYANPDAFQ